MSAIVDNSKSNEPQRQNRPDEQQKPVDQPYVAFKSRPSDAAQSLLSGSVFGNVLKTTNNNRAYAQIKKKIAEIYTDNVQQDISISLIDLDNVTHSNLVFSSIVIAMKHESKAAFYVLTIDGTGTLVQPPPVVKMNRQITTIRFPSDTIDKVVIDLAMSKVAAEFKLQIYDVTYTGGCVVPIGFDTEDATLLQDVAFNAILALGTELSMIDKQFSDIDVSTIVPPGNQLIVNISSNNAPVHNTLGYPVRSDILIETDVKSPNRDQNAYTLNNSNKVTVISSVRGYIELIYIPVNNNQYGQPQQTGINSKLTYMPNFVITDIATAYGRTPGLVMMAIASSPFIRTGDTIYSQFRATATSKKEVDIRNIGAINIDVNVDNSPTGFGTPIDTSIMKAEHVAQLLHTALHKQVLISIDCPVNSPESWYLSVFSAAMNGDNGARMLIINSINKLTNGQFVNYFKQNDPLFITRNPYDYIHMGYYKNHLGVKADLRHIDYLAMLNLKGIRDPQAIRNWSDTFTLVDVDWEIRLSDRLKLIQEATSETAVITGIAQRVTFSTQILTAIEDSVRASGVSLSVNNNSGDGEFLRQRGVATYATSGAIPMGASFANSKPFDNYGGNSRYQQGGRIY